jgi:hypothetical protein
MSTKTDINGLAGRWAGERREGAKLKGFAEVVTCYRIAE